LVCDSGVKFVTTSAGSPAKFIAPLIDEVKPVRQIIEETVAQFFAIPGRLGGLASQQSFG
jgi:enoyl-[acyl-carrier protein] reductase II